jgi:hypothetical protein
MIREIKIMMALRRVNKALEQRRKGVKNWKTSLFGALAAMVLAIKGALDPSLQPIAESVAGLLTAIGLFFAKDHNK